MKFKNFNSEDCNAIVDINEEEKKVSHNRLISIISQYYDNASERKYYRVNKTDLIYFTKIYNYLGS